MPEQSVSDDFRLCEMGVLGRLGAVVSPVSGSAESRLKLAHQRARLLKSQLPSVGLQEAFFHKSTAVSSAKADLHEKEQKLVDVLEHIDNNDAGTLSEQKALVSQQEAEVRKARLQLIGAEESRNLGELALQYANLQGEAKVQNGQHSFLSAIRASQLASSRNNEIGARAIEQIRRAKAEIAAAREKSKVEELGKNILCRPHSSPVVGELPLLRPQQTLPGSAPVLSRLPRTCTSKPFPAHANVATQEEAERERRERWAQHVREALQIQKRSLARCTHATNSVRGA